MQHTWTVAQHGGRNHLPDVAVAVGQQRRGCLGCLGAVRPEQRQDLHRRGLPRVGGSFEVIRGIMQRKVYICCIDYGRGHGRGWEGEEGGGHVSGTPRGGGGGDQRDGDGAEMAPEWRQTVVQSIFAAWTMMTSTGAVCRGPRAGGVGRQRPPNGPQQGARPEGTGGGRAHPYPPVEVLQCLTDLPEPRRRPGPEPAQADHRGRPHRPTVPVVLQQRRDLLGVRAASLRPERPDGFGRRHTDVRVRVGQQVGQQRCVRAGRLAGGETVILLTSPLHHY